MSPVHTIIKGVALVVGFPLCLLALMSVVGLVLDNVWGQFGIALAVMNGVPLFIADKLLPDDDVTKGRGVPSDVLAVTWLLVSAGVLGVGLSVTGPMLSAEADRLNGTMFEVAEAPLRWLGGVAPEEVDVPDDSDEAGDAVADAGVDAEPETPDAAADAAEVVPEETPEVSDDAIEPAEIFARWAESVVAIQVSGAHGAGGGTGFFVAANRVVTNSHVVHDMENIFVKMKDGIWASEVVLIDENADRDLALLEVRLPHPGAPVVLGTADDVGVGDRAVSIGNPLGLEHTLTDGLISSRRLYNGTRYFQTSAPISPGNSGGPLFDDHGRVIGVSVAQVGGFGRAQNLNLAIPVDDLVTFLAREPEEEPRRVGGGEPEQRPGSW